MKLLHTTPRNYTAALYYATNSTDVAQKTEGKDRGIKHASKCASRGRRAARSAKRGYIC